MKKPSSSSLMVGQNIETPLLNVWTKNLSEKEGGGIKSMPAEVNFFEAILIKINSGASDWIVSQIEIETDKMKTLAIYVVTVNSKICG